MRFGFFLMLLLFACQDGSSQEMPQVQIPESRPPRKNVTVTVTGKDKIYIKGKVIPKSLLDSALKMAIDSSRERTFDSARVVILVDKAAHFGVVYDIMRLAKRFGAMVVVNLK